MREEKDYKERGTPRKGKIRLLLENCCRCNPTRSSICAHGSQWASMNYY